MEFSSLRPRQKLVIQIASQILASEWRVFIYYFCCGRTTGNLITREASQHSLIRTFFATLPLRVASSADVQGDTLT